MHSCASESFLCMLVNSILHTLMQAVRHLEARRRQFASEASEAQMKQMLQSLRRQQQVALERHEQWLSAENIKLKERMQFMVLISAFCLQIGHPVVPCRITFKLPFMPKGASKHGLQKNGKQNRIHVYSIVADRSAQSGDGLEKL